MKEIFKNSISLFGRIVTINIMCFFLVISLSVLITAAFSENIGYVAMGTSSENEQSVELYRHYYEDGEDTKRAEYEENGYTVSESKIRSEVSKYPFPMCYGSFLYYTFNLVYLPKILANGN